MKDPEINRENVCQTLKKTQLTLLRDPNTGRYYTMKDPETDRTGLAQVIVHTVVLPGLLCRTAIRHCSGVLKKSDDITLCSPSAQPACKEYIHVINHIKTIRMQLSTILVHC